MNSPDFGATPVWQPQVSRVETDDQALPSCIFSEPQRDFWEDLSC